MYQNASSIQNNYGISAERRSIYRDIDEINLISLMLDQGCTLEQAKEMLEDGDDSLKTVVYDHRMKGFYVAQRKYTFDDIRLLAECVYSAKFVTEKDSRDLMDIVCSYVSDSQAKASSKTGVSVIKPFRYCSTASISRAVIMAELTTAYKYRFSPDAAMVKRLLSYCFSL